MDLESFWVSGFRCLADIDEIPMHNPTILTGANDGGKTSALAALSFLLGGSIPVDDDRTLAREGDANPPGGIEQGRFAEVRTSGRFRLNEMESADLELPREVTIRRVVRNSGASYEFLTSACSEHALRQLEQKPLEELKTLVERFSLEIDGHAGQKATYLSPLEDHAATYELEDAWITPPSTLIEMLPSLITFSDDRPEDAIRQALMGVYQSTLEDDSVKEQLADLEKLTRAAMQEEATNLEAHLRMRCQELVDVRIVPEVSFRDQFPTVTIESGSEHGELISLSASGAGLQQRIALATWEFTQEVVQRTARIDRPLIICYDEPDTHLDYNHQRNLAELVRSQSELPGVSVILATHALNLIDRVPVEKVVHLVQDEGRTSVERLLVDEHQETDRFLADVATAMGLRTSVLLHERCFVAVEGVTEAHALPILFRKAMGMPLQSAGLALIPASGNAGALLLAKHLVSQGRLVRIIVDEDTFNSASTKRKFRSAALSEAGIDPTHVYRVGRNELEDLFSDEQWAQTANEKWPREDDRDWVAADFTALRGRPKFSNEVRSIVQEAAPETAPEDKPSYLVAVAHQLRAPEDIPSDLRRVFAELVETAD